MKHVSNIYIILFRMTVNESRIPSIFQGKHKCDECEQSFSRAFNLRRHKVSRHPFTSTGAETLRQPPEHGPISPGQQDTGITHCVENSQAQGDTAEDSKVRTVQNGS